MPLPVHFVPAGHGASLGARQPFAPLMQIRKPLPLVQDDAPPAVQLSVHDPLFPLVLSTTHTPFLQVSGAAQSEGSWQDTTASCPPTGTPPPALPVPGELAQAPNRNRETVVIV